MRKKFIMTSEIDEYLELRRKLYMLKKKIIKDPKKKTELNKKLKKDLLPQSVLSKDRYKKSIRYCVACHREYAYDSYIKHVKSKKHKNNLLKD